jgi:tetratricopeptide (TPR) repeat protein
VKIMDFGVARLTTASMTGTGNIVGTADYMSPEQVKGAKVDGRSDLFSVGCMLYELLAGRRPFHSDNLMAIFYKITHEDVNYGLLPQGPEFDALRPILERALAKSLEERYQTAYDFAVALREYLKAWGTSAAGAHALEQLVDLEPPPSSPPQPLTDAPGATIVPADEGDIPSATMDLGPTARKTRAPTTLRAGTGTVKGAGPTVVGATQAPTVLTPTVKRGASARIPPAMARREPAPSGGSPILYVVLGAMGVALLAAGGYIYVNKQGAKPTEPTVPPATEMAAPPSTAPPATIAAATPPPPTAAPPPTFAVKKGSTAMRAAQAAFARNDYDQAMAQAQKALAEDRDDAQAKSLVEAALKGQRAESHFNAAETALRQGQLDRAMTEANAGHVLADWDPRGPGLVAQIQRQQQAAQQAQIAEQQKRQAATLQNEVNGLLNQADNALAGQKYDAAIGLYDEVLKRDPANQRAAQGRGGAIAARAVAQAASNAGSRVAPGKSFVSARTQAQSIETRKSSSVPEGFEDTPGVTAKKGSQAAELPGKILFDIDPEAVKPGENYTVKVYLLNEGNAPIQITQMMVNPRINGRGVSAPVQAQVKDVAPQQKALLMSSRDIWKEDTTSWSMEVTVSTARGESYKNQVTWK